MLAFSYYEKQYNLFCCPCRHCCEKPCLKDISLEVSGTEKQSSDWKQGDNSLKNSSGTPAKEEEEERVGGVTEKFTTNLAVEMQDRVP